MSDKALDDAVTRYEGPFVESADLMHVGAVRVEIENVIAPETEKDSKGQLIKRPMLVLKGAKKNRFILGKTNVRILKAMFGAKASEWAGKTISIGVRYLKEAFGQKNVPTLRILPPEDVPLPFGVRKHFGREKPLTQAELASKD